MTRLFVLSALAAGCGMTAHFGTPVVEVRPHLCEGTRVTLGHVVDRRERREVYVKKNLLNWNVGWYAPENDPAQALEESLSSSLHLAGLEVVPDGAPWRVDATLSKLLVEMANGSTFVGEAVISVKLTGPDGSVRTRRFVGHGVDDSASASELVQIQKALTLAWGDAIEQALRAVTTAISTPATEAAR